MNETKLWKHAAATPEAPETDPQDRKPAEIRVLDDFELVLAGGGDGEISWP